MKWNEKEDIFILTRDEAVNLLLFNLAWMYEPEKRRPIGYKQFHKEILQPLDRLLIDSSLN